jgi:hypothetical protein
LFPLAVLVEVFLVVALLDALVSSHQARALLVLLVVVLLVVVPEEV